MKFNKFRNIVGIISGITLTSITLSSCSSQYPFIEPIFQQYTVSFYQDEALQRHICDVTVYEGENAIYPEATYGTPTKEEDRVNTYTWTGWSQSLTDIRQNMSVYATFSENIKSYTVRFYTEDNSLLSQQEVLAGESAIAPEAPLKEGNDQYNYVFDRWAGGDYTEVYQDMDLRATYRSEVRQYTVSYYNYDSNLTPIYQEEVDYGSYGVGPLVNPTRPSIPTSNLDEIISYVFDGWYTQQNGQGTMLNETTIVRNTNFYANYSQVVTASNQKLIKDKIDSLPDSRQVTLNGERFTIGRVGLSGLGLNIGYSGNEGEELTFVLYYEGERSLVRDYDSTDDTQASLINGTFKTYFMFNDADGLIQNSGFASFESTSVNYEASFGVTINSGTGLFRYSSEPILTSGTNLNYDANFLQEISYVVIQPNNSLSSASNEFFRGESFTKPF